MTLDDEGWSGTRKHPNRVAIASLTVASRGGVQAIFSADGMFTEHAIAVRLSAAGTIRSIGLA